MFHSDPIFQNATLAQSSSSNNPDVDVDHTRPVKIRRVNHWRSVLKQKLVLKGKRKPSIQGMSKSQVLMLRKRSKLKKLAKRKK